MSQIRLNKTPELEELLEKSNIKFPRPINRNAARHLLMLIMRDMPAAHVGYSSTVRGDIDRLDEETEKLIAKGLEEYRKGHYIEIKTDKQIDAYLKSL